MKKIIVNLQTGVTSEEDFTESEIAEIMANQPVPPDPQIAINAENRAYLLSTDWYVVRYSETGVAIPEEIKTARQAARDAIV